MKLFEQTTPRVEASSERERLLEKIKTFNVQEKKDNLRELAKIGISTVKSFFQRIDFKNTFQSLRKNKSDTPPKPTTDTKNLSTENEKIIDDSSAISTNTSKLQQENIIEKDYTVLREINDSSEGSLKFNIYHYYKEKHNNKITKYAKQKILQKNMYLEKDSSLNQEEQLLREQENEQAFTSEKNRIIETLIQKRISDFQNSVDTKLRGAGLSLIERTAFLDWRVDHPPQEKTLLIHNEKNGIQIKNDAFASDDAIKQFLKYQAHTSSDKDVITTEDIEKQIADSFPSMTHAKNNTAAQDTKKTFYKDKTKEQLAYDIEKNSHGWVDHTMYDKVSDIPAKEAIHMIGSVNAELRPAGRAILSEMHYIAETKETFGDVIKYFLDHPPDDTESITQQKLHSLSNIVNKLNKVAIHMEQN